MGRRLCGSGTTSMMAENKIPYVYIAGLSHSGSTLLAFLLNAHPELVSIGEASRVGEVLPDRWATRKDLCSCGKPFFYCEFWNRTLAGLAARGFGLQASDPFDGPESEAQPDQRKWQAFVEAVLDVSGANVFVDASKAAAYVTRLQGHSGLDLKVINLLRDGRGVIFSWMKRLPDTPPEIVIGSWVQHENERAARLRSMDPDRILEVRYEDLCLTPVETLEKIFTFVGVDPAFDVTVGYKSAVNHHVIGNQMRLTGDEQITLDETWRREMDDRIIEKFFDLGGAINARNGYAG